MSDIMSRLKKLGVTKGFPEDYQSPKPKGSHGDSIEILKRSFPNGIVVENDYGPCFINRRVQPLTEPHGRVIMTDSLRKSPLFDSMLGMPVLRKEDTLAFDTETSGLSTGSAAFIFMLGLGYFEGDNYIVDQLILPDLDCEKAFLRQTELIFSRFPILLSYNGKSFDIPMLQSRLRFHMMPDFTGEIKHIDLLHLSRRYWKPRLGSVRLADVEQYILKLQRSDEEVPGYMAPELYRDCLRTRDASHITGVAYHNQIDVVSLSAYLLFLNDLCARSENDLSLWEQEGASESAVLKNNIAVLQPQAIASLPSCTPKEKKALAAKLTKTNPETAALIFAESAERGDLESAQKAVKLYQKLKNAERFEHFRELSIRLIETDETMGPWKKAEALDKLRKLKPITLSKDTPSDF